MKQKIVAIFWALVITLNYSCQRSMNWEESDRIESEFVKEARRQYHDTFKNEIINGIKRADKNGGNDIQIQALWDKAKEANINGEDFVEVPLALSRRILALSSVLPDSSMGSIGKSSISQSFDRLIVSRKKKMPLDFKIVRYFPDSEYLTKNGNDASHNFLIKLDKNFNGYLEYLSLEGVTTAIVRIDGGQRGKTIYYKNESNAGQLRTAQTDTLIGGYNCNVV